MRVVQTLFVSILVSLLGLLLALPSATADEDDSQPVSEDWADTFSTLNCYCYDWEQPDGQGPEQYHSGSYFGISYYNREFDIRYNWTTLEVRNQIGRLLKHQWNWDLQPKLGKRCFRYDDHRHFCYTRYGNQVHARYSYQDYHRLLPRDKFSKKYFISMKGECVTICPEVVKLPHVSFAMSHRVEYRMLPICLTHLDGDCEATSLVQDGIGS